MLKTLGREYHGIIDLPRYHSSSSVPSAWLLPIIASHLAQGTFRKRNRCTQRSPRNFQRSKHSSNCDNELKPIYTSGGASNTIDSSFNDEGNRTILHSSCATFLNYVCVIRIMCSKNSNNVNLSIER